MITAKHPYRSISAVNQAIENGESVRSIVQAHLDAIQTLDGELNAIAKLNDKALDDADELDTLKADERGPLHGVPVVVKDQIDTAGIRTAYGSKVCKDHVPERDSTLVSKLKDAGAVIIAKTTMPDWAASWFSTSSLTGTTGNPHETSRDAGGSSSGSGAAVASGMAIVGIGGDTGGSIRLPSSFCGLVGVRVTPGRISRDGMSALVKPQDTPGPMAHSIEDAARILDVIVGFDDRDEYTSINVMSPGESFVEAIKSPSLKGKRIGVLREAFGNHKGINEVLDRRLKQLDNEGAELVDVSIPELEYFMTFTSVYSTRSKGDINAFLASREKLAHLKIEDILRDGDYHEALDLIDAIAKGPTDYLQSPHFGRRIVEQARFQRVVAGIFAREKLDAIIYPTCQLLAPKTKDVLEKRWTCLNYPTNTIIASQLLFPAISVPLGKTKDDEEPEGPELPVGLEILGLPLQEGRIMSLAAAVEALA